MDEPTKPKRKRGADPIRAPVSVTLPIPLLEWLRSYSAARQTTQSATVEEALEALQEMEEPGR